jgi:Chaperone of endosialidase
MLTLSSSNYSTILVDSKTNQLRYLAPIHQFQNWGANQNPYTTLSNMVTQSHSIDVLTITNSNVGIGTVLPANKLHIVNKNSSNTLTIDGNNSMTGLNIVANSATPGNGLYISHTTAGNAIIQNFLGSTSIKNGSGNAAINLDTVNNVGITGTTTAQAIIANSLSLGTTNTNSYTLNVLGTGYINNNFTVGGTTALNGNVGIGISGMSGSGILTTAGNVGINTTSTAAALTVSGGGVAVGTNVATNNKLNVVGSVAIGTYATVDAVSPGNGLVVSGNVGIGVTSGANALNVGNSVSIGSYARNNTASGTVDSLIIGSDSSIGGYIGIGTSSPTCSLDVHGAAVIGNISSSLTPPTNGLAVYGAAAIGAASLSSQNSTLNVGGNATFGYNTTGNPSGNATANGLLVLGKVGIGNTAGSQPRNMLEIAGSVAIGSDYYGVVNSLPNNCLIVSSNVGIGTTNPAYKLHVVGPTSIGVNDTTTTNNLTVTGNLTLSGGLNVAGLTQITNVSVTETSSFQIKNSNVNVGNPGLKVSQNTGGTGVASCTVADFYDTFSSTVPILSVSYNSNVLIGGNPTASGVTIPGNAGYYLGVNGGVYANTLTVNNITANSINASGGGSINGLVSAANLTGTGNIPVTVLPSIINTSSGVASSTTPYTGTTFTIGSTVNATNNASFPIITIDQYGRITNTSSVNIVSSQWLNSTPPQSPPLIYFDGIVGIGTTGDQTSAFTSQPGTASTYLYVDGDIYATGDVIALSDAKYKTDLKVIDNPIEKIKKVSGYTYTRTDTVTKQRQTGVIAQELEAILPEAVQTSTNGDKSVAYGNVIGLLIECIKEQQKEIDELKKLFVK